MMITLAFKKFQNSRSYSRSKTTLSTIIEIAIEPRNLGISVISRKQDIGLS